jgi:hypothetical protein
MTTIKLTEKQRDDLKSLLEDHQTATDALDRAKKATYTRILTVSSEDGQDFYEVPLNYILTKRVLTEQIAWIEKELNKIGISV